MWRRKPWLTVPVLLLIAASPAPAPLRAQTGLTAPGTPPPLLHAGPIIEIGGASPFFPETVENPRVAALAQGGFAVFWTLHGHHAPFPSLGSRLYDSTDRLIAEQVTVTGAARAFQIAAHPAGGLTVVGDFFDGDLTNLGVLGERFDPSGQSRTGDYPLPTMPAAVAAGRGGGGLFALLPQTAGRRLSLLRLGPYGHPLGPPTTVTPEPTCATSPPALASDLAGRTAIAWLDSSCNRIFLRRFDAAGKPLGAAVEVDPLPGRRPGPMAVAAGPDGRLVVVWEAEGDGGDRGIFARRFAASNRPRPRGDVFPVNGDGQGDQTLPSVAVQGDGRFLVAWQSPGDGGTKIFGRYFGDDGQPAGSAFPFDSRFRAAETQVSVSATIAGSYVAVWLVQEPDTVFGRRFAP